MKLRRSLLLIGFAFSISVLSASTLREQLALAQTDNDWLAQTEIIQRILQSGPNDQDLRETLGSLWIQLQDYDQAEKTVQDAALVSPSFRAQVMAQVLYVRDEKKDDAIALLQAYHAKAPDDLDVTRLLAGYLAETHQEQALVKLLDEAPGVSADAALLITRAEARRTLQDFPGALRDFGLADKLAPEDSAVTSRRPAFERLREAQGNIETTSAALTKNPADVAALLARSYWYIYSAFASERAAVDAAAAYQAEPAFISARLLNAYAGVAMGKPTAEDAKKDMHVDVTQPLPAWKNLDTIFRLDTSLKKQPRDTKALAARCAALSEAQQYLLAEDDAVAVLALSPNDPAARLAKIKAIVKLKDFEAAAAEYRLFDASKPPSDKLAAAAGEISDAAFALSRFEIALDFATRAIQAHPAPQYYKQRSAIYQRLNRKAEAEADMAKVSTPIRKAKAQ